MDKHLRRQKKQELEDLSSFLDRHATNATNISNEVSKPRHKRTPDDDDKIPRILASDMDDLTRDSPEAIIVTCCATGEEKTCGKGVGCSNICDGPSTSTTGNWP